MSRLCTVTVATEFSITTGHRSATLARLLVAEHDLVTVYARDTRTESRMLGGYDQYLKTLTDVCTLIKSPGSEEVAVVDTLFVPAWQQALLQLFAEKKGITYLLMSEIFDTASEGKTPDVPAVLLDAWRPHVADVLEGKMFQQKLARARKLQADIKGPDVEVAKAVAKLTGMGYTITPPGD